MSGNREQFTAIGDEEGYLRLFSTNQSLTNDAKVRHHFKVHDNAIMDVDISADDLRIATACGDRTGRIVDTLTQTVACELSNNHWDSLRQVSFQPGHNHGDVIATSDRAGCVQIWDLRCSAKPTGSFSTDAAHHRDDSLDMFQAKSVNVITNAHERITQGTRPTASVTAIHWMPPGREHLLLTASEANAAIKLWDARYIKPRRQAEETPLAVTKQPTSHTWRSYGITSLAVSADAARLYAVCKDSTVYAYSTAHLMLGYAPELLDGATKRRPTGTEGLGPLYGLRNDMFRAQSFYIKCAIRPSSNYASKSHGNTELLATGSSDSCAVLFPLDETSLRSQCAKKAHELPSNNLSTPAVHTPSTGGSPGVPIFKCGTPLIRGHSREVTTVSWSRDGVLVTASDDSIVRRWYGGNRGQARYLRQVGEFGGERHMAGWADVASDWDEDDDDEA